MYRYGINKFDFYLQLECSLVDSPCAPTTHGLISNQKTVSKKRAFISIGCKLINKGSLGAAAPNNERSEQQLTIKRKTLANSLVARKNPHRFKDFSHQDAGYDLNNTINLTSQHC